MKNFQQTAKGSALGRRGNRFRTRSLSVATTGLAVSIASEPAAAAIISNLAVGANTGDTFSVDPTGLGLLAEIELTTSGMMNIKLSLDSPNGNGGNPNSNVLFASFPDTGMMPTDFLTLLNSGDTVDGSLSFTDEAFLTPGGSANSGWSAGETGYAGFVIDDGLGTPLYGWAQVQYNSSGTTVSVTQFAYDDSGLDIGAGYVPEPSTLLLVGIGLAGLSAASHRQRRALPSGSNV